MMTGSFRNSERINLIESLPRDSEIKVLITRPNHRLGNQLLLTPLIQEINKQFPNCKIHLIVNGNLSYILLSNYQCVETIFNLPKKPFNNIIGYLKKSLSLILNKYDIAIVGCEDSNSSKIFVKLSRAKLKIYNSGTNKLNKPEHIAKIPVYNLRKFMNPSEGSTHRYPKLSIKLSRQEIEKGDQLIKALFNSNKKTICIFTFATGNKCLSKKWWLKFYKELKTEFTDFNVLEILPNENVSQINYESVHFYSNNLREIASVIENSVVFIGADSGIMHLSSSTNTTTFGLFNVTDPKTYGPYGGNNIPLDTNSVKLSEIIERIKEAIF